jgi:uncharacterized membrane protein
MNFNIYNFLYSIIFYKLFFFVICKMIKILFTLLLLDAIWISFFLYKPFSIMIENVQKQPLVLRPIGAIVAYMSLFLLAIIFLPKVSHSEAFLLGFLVYCVYDSTNYATLLNWNFTVALFDSLWGGVLFYILKRFVL